MVRNMTEGDPLKLILPFMVPLLIGNVFQQLYNIADIIIVGRTIGVNALAAVGATAPLFMMLVVLTMGLSNGFTVVTGQRYGAGDLDGVPQCGDEHDAEFVFCFDNDAYSNICP